MGFRWRKRTKGKNAWLNFSYSKKNGFNTSLSVKSGPFTWNSGNRKRPTRLTTNLPGGFYHVTSNKKKSNKSTSDNSITPSTSSSGSQEGLGILGIIIIALFAGCVANIFTDDSDLHTEPVVETIPTQEASPSAPIADEAPPAPEPKESFAIPDLPGSDAQGTWQRFQVPASKEEDPPPETFKPSHNGDYIYRPGATPPEESTDEKVQL